MANEIGRTIKNTAVDAGKALQRAGEAVILPTRLGNDGLLAFKTLRFLDNFTALLPASLQPLVKALLGVGIENVGRHGDPQSKDAVRGFTSSIAIKEGRVPPEVIERAVGKEQKAAITKAAKEGDLATVKSILRHNKKVAAQPPAKPVVTDADTAGLDARAQQGVSAAKLVAQLKTANIDVSPGHADIRMQNGDRYTFDTDGKGVAATKNGKKLSDAEAAETMGALRDAYALKGGSNDAVRTFTSQMQQFRATLGVQDEIAGTKAAVLAGNRVVGDDGKEYSWDLAQKPPSAFVKDLDGSEHQIRGIEMLSLAELIERLMREHKLQSAKGSQPSRTESELGKAAVAFRAAK